MNSKEKKAACTREWYKKQKDDVAFRQQRRAIGKRYSRSPKAKARRLAYRQANAEKIAARVAKYFQENKERIYETQKIRRLRSRGIEHTLYDFREICQHYNYRCLRCNKKFKFEDLTRDHIIPISRGGSDTPDNIQPLCKRCNSSKAARHQTDYRPDRGEFFFKQLSFL